MWSSRCLWDFLADLCRYIKTHCKTSLRHWIKGNCKTMTFGIAMVWREPTNLLDICHVRNLVSVITEIWQSLGKMCTIHGFSSFNDIPMYAECSVRSCKLRKIAFKGYYFTAFLIYSYAGRIDIALFAVLYTTCTGGVRNVK